MRSPFVAAAILATLFHTSALHADTDSKAAVPGTVNYIEGQAFIGTQGLNSKAISSVELQPGRSLSTESGKVELLLTPGVFLRVGDNSLVKMISPSITDTEVEVNAGQAMIEVAEIHPENNLLVDADDLTTKLLKTGLYDFDVNHSELLVFAGEAEVQEGNKHATVKAGHELSLTENGAPKSRRFDKKSYSNDDLYRWSSLRSAYLAEANVDAAAFYAWNGWGPWGPGWWGAGWYWDPWFDAFTFIPGDGIFCSPFGWGFYSPWWVYQAPFYGEYGYGYRPYYRSFSTDFHSWGPGSHYVTSRHYANGTYRGGLAGGAFHSGPNMTGGFNGLASGGFGGGGFHGAAGFGRGGGFHGR
jgi:hypothetical protein